MLDAEELHHVRAILDQLDRVRREPAGDSDYDGHRYLRNDLAGSPLDLESLLADLLER